VSCLTKNLAAAVLEHDVALGDIESPDGIDNENIRRAACDRQDGVAVEIDIVSVVDTGAQIVVRGFGDIAGYGRATPGEIQTVRVIGGARDRVVYGCIQGIG